MLYMRVLLVPDATSMPEDPTGHRIFRTTGVLNVARGVDAGARVV